MTQTQAAICAVPKPVAEPYPSHKEFDTQILNIGVSTSALFDTRKSDAYFHKVCRHPHGELLYMEYMRDNTDNPFAAGPALPFIKKLLSLNTPERILVNLSILSQNNPQVALRVHHSLYEHGLYMKSDKSKIRFGMGEIYTKGRPITPQMLRNFGLDLFLSTDETPVKAALAEGVAAGKVLYPSLPEIPSFSTPNVLVAFDFDRVMGYGNGNRADSYKQDSEAYFQDTSLVEYWRRESKLTTLPAHPGPLASFYLKLVRLRDELKAWGHPLKLELAIVTARSSDPFARVQATLDHWGQGSMEEDYRISTRRTPKAPHLAELQADAFFDDSLKHVKGAAEVTTAIWVPHVEPQKPQKTKGKKNGGDDPQTPPRLH